MSKFRNLIKSTGKAVKEVRGNLLAENAMYNAEQLVRIKEAELRGLKMKENDMTDFYPESEFSLRVTSKDFDDKKWFGELCNLRVQIANKEIEVDIIKGTYEEWFGDEKKEGPKEGK